VSGYTLDPTIQYTDLKYSKLIKYIQAVPTIDFNNSLLTHVTNVVSTTITNHLDVSAEIVNFPASQTINGTVSVDNFPATQPVSGSVNVDNFPALQNVSGDVRVMNFSDISGLHVVVENPVTSVTADISGQYVTANGLCPIVTNWLPYGTLYSAYPTGDVFEYGIELYQDVSAALFLGKEIYALDNSGLIVNLGTAFNYGILDVNSIGMKPYLVDYGPDYIFSKWGLAPEYNVIKPLLQDTSGQLVVSIPDAVSATISNFPQLQSVALNALAPNFVPLVGSLSVASPNLVPASSLTTGVGTDFVTDFVVGNLVYYLTADGVVALLGEVYSISSPTSMRLINATIYEIINVYGKLLGTETVELSARYNTHWLSVAVENTVTEKNSTDILAIVTAISETATSIDGKIVICNTSDISGTVITSATNSSMGMYASGFETFTPLTGLIAEISGTDVSGEGTAFLSQVALGDQFWLLKNAVPFLWGVVATVPTDRLVTLVTSLGNSSGLKDAYAINLVETMKPLLLDSYGDLRVNIVANSSYLIPQAVYLTEALPAGGNSIGSVVISGDVTEINSAAIASSVASIDGKIVTCNTSDISGSVIIKGNVTETNSAAIAASVASIDSKITVCNTSNISGSVIVSNFPAIQNVSGSVGLKAAFSNTNGNLVNLFTDSNNRLVTASQIQALDSNSLARVLRCDASGATAGILCVNNYPQGTTNVSGTVFLASGTNTIGSVGLKATNADSGSLVNLITDNNSFLMTSSLAKANNPSNISMPLKCDASGVLNVNSYPQGTTTVTGDVNVSGQVVLATGTNTIGKVYSYTNPASIITLVDISAGTGLTVSSSPVTLTAWSPANLGATTTVCYYKFYNKVGATSSDTPVFTYPVTSSANNTITSIPLYNLTFSVACSVRATLNYAANDTTVPLGRQISNILYDGFI